MAKAARPAARAQSPAARARTVEAVPALSQLHLRSSAQSSARGPGAASADRSARPARPRSADQKTSVHVAHNISRSVAHDVQRTSHGCRRRTDGLGIAVTSRPNASLARSWDVQRSGTAFDVQPLHNASNAVGTM